MPDGTVIKLNDQSFRIPEILFNNKIYDHYELDNFAQKCIEIIDKCDEDLRKNLYNNIILSGGNTLFKGFGQRLRKEIIEFAPISMKKNIRVIDLPEKNIMHGLGLLYFLQYLINILIFGFLKLNIMKVVLL